MTYYPARFPTPPSDITGALGTYLRDMARILNESAAVSIFSALTPNSVVTGLPGYVAVNVGSASTDSRVWVLGGTGDYLRNTGWVVLRTLS